MVKLAQAIVVEGRYDKNTLAQLVDAPIFVTNGFGIFRDREMMELLRTVAEKRGLIVLTDSDGAGLVIRNRLKSAIPPQYLLHAYIPDVPGKEKRKASPGREGKLGVEGMPPEVLIAALRNAGATFLDTPADAPADVPATAPMAAPATAPVDVGTSIACPVWEADNRPAGDSPCPRDREQGTITKNDLFELGLSGGPDSRQRRKALQKELGLPENLSTNALLTALNCLYTRAELEAIADSLRSGR